MSWQLIIIILILVSSIVTMFTRRVALSTKRVFYGVGAFSYLAIAISGTIMSIIYNHGLPTMPSGNTWVYIILEGMFIPIAWLFQYKLISYIGASNAVIVSSINTIGVAIMGIIFLNEPLSVSFVCGSLTVLISAYVALQIQPDLAHRASVSLKTKLILALGTLIFYGLGLYFEKLAINAMDVWNYSSFGWSMQFIGALMIFLIFGRHEIPSINRLVVSNGLILGFMTSIAGGLYIFALSKGTLSHTIVASSGKVALTMMLSALMLKERNQLQLRIASFALSTIGICLVIF